MTMRILQEELSDELEHLEYWTNAVQTATNSEDIERWNAYIELSENNIALIRGIIARVKRNC